MSSRRSKSESGLTARRGQPMLDSAVCAWPGDVDTIKLQISANDGKGWTKEMKSEVSKGRKSKRKGEVSDDRGREYKNRWEQQSRERVQTVEPHVK